MVYVANVSALNYSSYSFAEGDFKEEKKCGEFPLVEKLIEDNFFAVGLFKVPDFRLIKANQKYGDYLKAEYHLESIPFGQDIKDFVPKFKGSELEKAWVNASETGESSYSEEFKTTSSNGIDNYWNCYNSPIVENGRVEFVVSMLYDVTDAVSRRQYIEDRNIELEKSIEMKDELLLLITHELKTPLSVITSSIQAIESICAKELTDRVRKYLNKIRQNTYRQLKLVNNILDNTRVNSGLFKLNHMNVDIVNLTSVIIDSIMTFAERKKIKIFFSSSLDSMVIKADVDQYERVILNLLSNAVKFTPEEKSIEVNIFQLVKNGVPKVCIQVKDQGIGIPKDKKEYIFERFGRVDKFLSTNSEGTGIGLYLVKMLVTLMGGEIELESEEGFGSTFTLIFPVLYTAIEHAGIEKRSERLATATAIEFSDIYYRA